MHARGRLICDSYLDICISFQEGFLEYAHCSIFQITCPAAGQK
jgi:hypothetical protein